MLSCLTFVQSLFQVMIEPEGSTTRRRLCVTIEKGWMAAYIKESFQDRGSVSMTRV